MELTAGHAFSTYKIRSEIAIGNSKVPVLSSPDRIGAFFL